MFTRSSVGTLKLTSLCSSRILAFALVTRKCVLLSQLNLSFTSTPSNLVSFTTSMTSPSTVILLVNWKSFVKLKIMAQVFFGFSIILFWVVQSLIWFTYFCVSKFLLGIIYPFCGISEATFIFQLQDDSPIDSKFMSSKILKSSINLNFFS